MTDGPSCLRYRHFDQTMKTLITAWLSSTVGERVTSLIKTQVVMVGKPCITHRSVIRSYKYYGEDNAEATQGTCNMINRHQRLGASNKDKRGGCWCCNMISRDGRYPRSQCHNEKEGTNGSLGSEDSLAPRCVIDNTQLVVVAPGKDAAMLFLYCASPLNIYPPWAHHLVVYFKDIYPCYGDFCDDPLWYWQLFETLVLMFLCW